MLFFYVDDNGDTHAHHEPLLDGETPLFCLSAVALRSPDWRDWDRSLWALKQTYFPNEIEAHGAKHPDLRPEHYEVKGHDLFMPSHARDRRRRAFIRGVFNLCQRLQARLFSAIWRKDPVNPVNPQSMYTKSLQILAERFQLWCEQLGETGIVIVDSRTRFLDFGVGASHLSYIFGHPQGRLLTRLTEAPMFANSTLSAGIQIADIIGASIYGYYYQRKCSTVSGLFSGSRPVTPAQRAAAGPAAFLVRAPARDYSHCRAYWPLLDGLQFRGIGPAPVPGAPSLGFYGFREVM